MSDHGRVKRVITKSGKPCDNLRSFTTRKDGYLDLTLHIRVYGLHVRKHALVHILVAEAFLPPRPTREYEVNHKDGIKSNCHVSNLEWNTPKQNTQHAIRLGLMPKGKPPHYYGEDHPHSKLTNKQRRKIIKRINKGEQARDVAPDYNVTAGAIKYTYKHKERYL